MPTLANVLAAWDASQAPAADSPAASGGAEALVAEAPRLRRLVHRLLGWPTQPGEVDDVVQETLLAAWRRRSTFRGEAQLTTWLHRIALRKALNHQRAATLRRRLFGWFLGDLPERPTAARLDREALHPEPTTSTPPIADERIDATQQALQQLAHRDREVLVLRYLEQREIPQLAALLGCSRAAVDARLSRARQRLRAALGLDATEDA